MGLTSEKEPHPALSKGEGSDLQADIACLITIKSFSLWSVFSPHHFDNSARFLQKLINTIKKHTFFVTSSAPQYAIICRCF
jgi:hypothetical protein